jgi:starch-binding outer membrane protein, SusD/RagB family
MKKYIITIFAGAIIFLASCKKFLDTTPTDRASIDTYYNTEGELNTALNGVYNIMNDGNLWGGNKYIDYDAAGDELTRNGGSAIAGANLFNYDGTYPTTSNAWAKLYEGINRANNVIENTDRPAMPDTNRKVIKGQALFLRAFYHFTLLKDWGNIPLKLKSTQSVTDVNIPAANPVTAYEQITADMIAAEAMVKPISAYTDNEHVTKSAVQAILARVYLHWAGYPLNDKSKYADCLVWAQKVKNSGLHSLNPDYRQVFINMIQDKYDTKEDIWEVGFAGNNAINATAKYSGIMGQQLGIPSNDATVGSCGSIFTCTPKLFNVFDTAVNTKDLRRDWACATYTFGTASPAVKTFKTITDTFTRAPGKWRRDYEIISPKAGNNTPINVPVIRYSDVLLMIAEAENELNNGPTTEAINSVNLVRERAYGAGYRVSAINIINQGAGYSGNTGTIATAPVITIGGTPIPYPYLVSNITRSSNNLATAYATVAGGKITAITLGCGGAFYDIANPPLVTITATAGSGAIATATLSAIVPTEAYLKPAQIAGKQSFKRVIVDERQRELCFEGNRRSDLIRWYNPGEVGNINDELKALATRITNTYPTAYKAMANGLNNFSAPRYLLFPIPVLELAANKALQQNSGY